MTARLPDKQIIILLGESVTTGMGVPPSLLIGALAVAPWRSCNGLISRYAIAASAFAITCCPLNIVRISACHLQLETDLMARREKPHGIFWRKAQPI